MSTSVSATTSSRPSLSPNTQVKQAIAAYISALNEALLHPARSTDALSRLIAPDCPCTSVLGLLRSEARQGRYLDYSYSVSGVSVQQVGELGGSATYVADQTAGHERTLDGKIIETFGESRARYSVHFRRHGDAWLLDRLDVVTK
jgi:hypothetical protein